MIDNFSGDGYEGQEEARGPPKGSAIDIVNILVIIASDAVRCVTRKKGKD